MAESVSKEEVQGFLTDLMQAPAEARAQVIAQLRREQAQVISDGAFYCERMHCVLAAPCHLQACDFWRKNTRIRNCALSVRGTERNEVMDIAKALDIDETAARQEIAEAFTRLREASLLESIDAAGVNRYTMVQSTGVCVVCGGVTDEPYHITEDGGYVYCRKECFREKPLNLLTAECTYRTDVRHILRIALDTFKQIPLIASALRIPRQSLLRHYEFYLGIKPTSFGLPVADIVDLLRRKHTYTADDFLIISKTDLSRYTKWQRIEDASLDLVRNL